MNTTQNVSRTPGAVSFGIRLGALFGPSVFGVTAAGLALPEATVDLGVDAGTVTWVLTAHALALGIGIALFGRWSDAAGGRIVLTVGSGLLLVGTGICLWAPDLSVLVLGRLCLGAGSGAMSASALSLVGSVRPEDRATVLGVFGGAMALFAACATLAGGVVTDVASWRATVVLPALALLAVPGCWRLLRRDGSGRQVDLLGAATLTTAVACVVILLQEPALGLGVSTIVAVVAVGGAALLLLVFRTRRTSAGFVPRDLVRDRQYRGAALVGAGTYAGLFSVMFVVPQVLTDVHGWSVLTVGLALLPGAAAGAALSRTAGRYALGSGARTWAVTIATAYGVALLVVAPLSAVAVGLVLAASLGFAAFSVVQVVVTGLMTGYLAPEQRGGGLGLLNLTFFVGGAVGSATAGAVYAVAPLGVTIAVLAVFPLLGALGFLALYRPSRL
ncbi:MFS transporter [Spiractinospora alimapuensis]|uniref:MFS transporter n=1 Tax=Spiractinospora alimapuensis TaxID=2820884 RepID=UPI001F47CF04|nr:MFS transporter [Spiractinospora alimapuensis]QVQ53472.1 MFS transporter [Spiractinospora alimapuensis]